MSTIHKHEAMPDGSVKLTQATFGPDGKKILENHSQHPTAAHSFVDGHGTHHETTHHVAADGLLHSEYKESTNGVHMKTTVLHGHDRKKTTDHAYGIHREETARHGGSTLMQENHRFGPHTQAHEIKAHPDITIEHSHSHQLGADGDEATLTSHLHPNGGEVFKGPNAAKDAQAAAWDIRKKHDPFTQSMGQSHR